MSALTYPINCLPSGKPAFMQGSGGHFLLSFFILIYNFRHFHINPPVLLHHNVVYVQMFTFGHKKDASAS